MKCLIALLVCIEVVACSKFPKPDSTKQAIVGQQLQSPPKEGDVCKPHNERWYPVADDQSAFLFCDGTRKKLKQHRCNSNDGLFKVFEPKLQRCIVANEEYRWLLMAPPMGIPTKKVGDSCSVNRDCSDGMYCNAVNGGQCACYLNYIEINLQCARITSVCQGTTYYPEQINGKPKVCSAGSPCPPGYACRLEGTSVSTGHDHGFCCLATANEVCGDGIPHIINGQPAPCYPNAASEQCPSQHSCQYYQPANRYYCCQPNKTAETVLPIGSTPASAAASNKARYVQHPDSFCTGSGLAYLYDGYPIVCNPNNSASCPKDYPCQKNERINLNFCCQNLTSTANVPTVLPPMPPPSPPPPPPLPPFSGLILPETGPVHKPIGPPSSPFPSSLGGIAPGGTPHRTVNFCGVNARAFIFDDRPVTCFLNDTLSCPPTYTCTLYRPFNASFCCQNSGPSESHLPYEPLVKGGSDLDQSTAAPTPPPSPTLSTTTTGTSSTTTAFKMPPPSGASTSQVCGSWGIPYTFEGFPVTCLVHHHGMNSTCPSDHICQYHPPSNAHFCCKSPEGATAGGQSPSATTSSTVSTSSTTQAPFMAISNPDGCPPQTYAARDHNGVIQVCDLLLAPDTCPTGTGCLYSALFGRYQCCGARVERWPQPSTSTSTVSSMTSTASGQSTTTTMMPLGGSTSTTTSSTTISGIVMNSTAGSHPIGGNSTIFTPPPPPTPDSTPATNSSSGVKKLASNSKYNDECSPGQVAYKDPSANETAACAANHADSCPGGYFCQWSQNSGKFLCCGVSAGCPNHGVAYVSAATWEVQRCSLIEIPSSCPPGYSCQTTVDGSNACCSDPIAARPPSSIPSEIPGGIPQPPEVPANPSLLPSAPSHLCPVGLPLNEQLTGGYRTCSETSACPSGYQCIPSSAGTVCCPIYQGKISPPMWYFHSPINSRNARRV